MQVTVKGTVVPLLHGGVSIYYLMGSDSKLSCRVYI